MLNTVNFIAIRNDSGQAQIQEVVSFPETEDGNRAVEQLFVDRIRKDNSHFEADIPFHIEDGFYCCSNGIELSIFHSTG